MVEKIRKQLGRAGQILDTGLAWAERDMVKSANSGVPVVSQLGKVLQPVSVGIRAAVANVTSGGGKYYKPTTRDERYFSDDALRELAGNIDKSGGRGTTRYRYSGLFGGNGMMGTAAAIEASQTVGGSRIVGNKLTDVFDIDRKDPYGTSQDAHDLHPAVGTIVDAAHYAVGKIFGSDADPDDGKVKTEIPMSVINRYRTRQDTKGGDSSSKSYGKRPDGTEKGRGWLGELKLPNGGVATEYSVGVNLDGKETLIPTLVPTLTKEQVATMVNDVIPNRKAVPEDILRSAALHAKERIAKGESVWAPTNAVKEVRQAAAGGDAGDNLQEPDVPVNSEPVADTDVNNGPRITVNPEVFNDKRDALCVAFNEAYRVVMEMNGFDPVSEPTDKQREFFADTAYADDETMLRRTILARICTFDTSVGDPTDEQLQEAVEFLSTVMEIGAPQNRWEQSVVQRTKDILEKSIGMPREEKEPQNPAPTDAGTGTQAAAGGGEAEEEDEKKSEEPTNAVEQKGQDVQRKEEEPKAKESASENPSQQEAKPDEKKDERPKPAADKEGSNTEPKTEEKSEKANEQAPAEKKIEGPVDGSAKPAATGPDKPMDKFEEAHKRFLERRAGFIEKNPNAVSKQEREETAKELAKLNGAGQDGQQPAQQPAQPMVANAAVQNNANDKYASYRNKDGKIEIEGKKISDSKMALFERRAEKAGLTVMQYLDTRSYGTQV